MAEPDALDSSAGERPSTKLYFPAPQSSSGPSTFQMRISQLCLQSCEPPLILSINLLYVPPKLATFFLLLASKDSQATKWNAFSSLGKLQ